MKKKYCLIITCLIFLGVFSFKQLVAQNNVNNPWLVWYPEHGSSGSDAPNKAFSVKSSTNTLRDQAGDCMSYTIGNDNRGYVYYESQTAWQLNIIDPRNQTLIGSVNHSSVTFDPHSVQGFYISATNKYYIAVCGPGVSVATAAVLIFDVTNVAAPVLVNTIRIPATVVSLQSNAATVTNTGAASRMTGMVLYQTAYTSAATKLYCVMDDGVKVGSTNVMGLTGTNRRHPAVWVDISDPLTTTTVAAANVHEVSYSTTTNAYALYPAAVSGSSGAHQISYDPTNDVVYVSQGGSGTTNSNMILSFHASGTYAPTYVSYKAGSSNIAPAGSLSNAGFHGIYVNKAGTAIFTGRAGTGIQQGEDRAIKFTIQSDGTAAVIKTQNETSVSPSFSVTAGLGVQNVQCTNLTPDESYMYSSTVGSPNATIWSLNTSTLAIIQRVQKAGPANASFNNIDIHSYAFTLSDFGDAASSYGIPVHNLVNTNFTLDKLRIGATVDGDTSAVTSAASNGDDGALTGGSGAGLNDDEDGISAAVQSSSVGLYYGMTGTYTISNIPVKNTTANNATLAGWIDFNHDGVFQSTEGTTVAVPINATTANLSWSVPATVSTGRVILRLRLSTDASLTVSTPTGILLDGEAEDYMYPTSLPVISGNVFNDVNANTIFGSGGTSGTGENGVNAGIQLYAYLIKGGVIIDSAWVNSTGNYSFPNVPQNAGAASVVIGINSIANGSASSLIINFSSSPPAGWLYIGSSSGLTTNGTGNSLALNIALSNITDQNFGITAAGYIYVHKKTLDESSSTDFTFSASGGSTSVSNFLLNDNPTYVSLLDLGASKSGRLYAAGNNGTLYYRNPGSSQWVATSITTARRVDGGGGDTAYVVTSTGTVLLFDGTVSSTIYTGANASDIGSTWDNRPYIIANTNRIYRYSGTGSGTAGSASWPQIGATSNNSKIDGDPSTGNIIVGKTDNNVYSITNTGVQTSLGRPANAAAATNAYDVAADASGAIYAVFANTAASEPYVFKWTSGTTWSTEELTTRNGLSSSTFGLTGGLGNEVWMVFNNFTSTLYGQIFTRSADGSNIWWIDDERVRTSPANGNSAMIAVIPGSYTITETVPAGWDLQEIELYDPGSNSAKNVVGNTATLNVTAGETVHVIFRNGVVNPFTMSSDCAVSYLETFGTGAVGTYGAALTGQTSYHYIGVAGNAEDGYYKVVSRTNPDFRGTSGSYFDHTNGAGNGRMAVFNASYDQNEFFRRRFTGLIAGATYSFSAWILNVSNSAILPNVTFKVIDPTTYNTLSSNNTGNIAIASGWKQYSLTFTATATVVDLVLQNNTIGGGGNDLALDDISLMMMPVSTPITTVTNTDCSSANSGSITVSSPVGATYEYSLNGTTYQSSTVFSGLAAGNYTVYARYVGTSNCAASKSDVIQVALCGTIFNDANGLNAAPANTVDGTGSNAGGLNVILYDKTISQVVATTAAAANGTFGVTGMPGHNFDVYITINAATIGQTAVPTVALPSNWVNTGEYFGTGAGSDATVNGILSVGIVNTQVSNVNFGIEQVPNSDAKVQSVSQPSINQFITLNGTGANPGYFTGSDPEDQTVPGTLAGKTIAITTLPSNGQLWYNGSQLSSTTTINNFSPSLMQFKATGAGYTSTTFSYAYVDKAGQQDPTPAMYTLTWSIPLPLKLSGFTAKLINCNSVKVNWQVSDISSLDHSEIEKGYNGMDYVVLTRNVYQSSYTDYSYIDHLVTPGKYYYRLRMVNEDGTFSYSDVIIISNDCADRQIAIYPNPVNDKCTITGIRSGERIQLFSQDGSLHGTLIADNTTVQVDLKRFPAGIYRFAVNSDGVQVKTLKLIKL